MKMQTTARNQNNPPWNLEETGSETRMNLTDEYGTSGEIRLFGKIEILHTMPTLDI